MYPIQFLPKTRKWSKIGRRNLGKNFILVSGQMENFQWMFFCCFVLNWTKMINDLLFFDYFNICIWRLHFIKFGYDLIELPISYLLRTNIWQDFFLYSIMRDPLAGKRALHHHQNIIRRVLMNPSKIGISLNKFHPEIKAGKMETETRYRKRELYIFQLHHLIICSSIQSRPVQAGTARPCSSIFIPFIYFKTVKQTLKKIQWIEFD